MKKTQKQWIAVIGLSVLICVLAIGQAGGDQPLPPRATPRSSGVVASARPVQSVEDPVIARDAFWNPGLVETKAVAAAPPKPLPQLSFEPPSSWIPPARPDTSELGLQKEAPAVQTEEKEQKEAPPKKLLRVCGFLTTSQTPTIMLSLNGEDPKTCKTTDRPWPNVTVLKVELDRATLKIADRKIVVTAGQEVQI